MLMIRLTRVGKKKHPTYRVVVQQKQKAPSSNVLEILGHYDPHTHPATLEVKQERLQYWVASGAQLSDTLHNLLLDKGLIQGTKRRIVSLKKSAAKEEPAAAPAAEAAPAAAPAEIPAEPPVAPEQTPENAPS